MISEPLRHQHTDYDLLLMKGIPRLDARHRIARALDAAEAKWK